MREMVVTWQEREAIKEKEMLNYKSFVKDRYIYIPVVNAGTGGIQDFSCLDQK